MIYKMRGWDWYKRRGIKKCRRYATKRRQYKKREKTVIIYKMRGWDWYKRRGIEKCRSMSLSLFF